MAYQVLARKWRPQDFDSVVGQGPVVQALRNALKDGRIAQAYLFSGIRGIGKTSVARVLAKALNCPNGEPSDPCNDCETCHEITAGSDLDVLEIDAATYSKVEQVRELTDSLQYGPARNPYKVVIIDEIHRLSRQAFDALLKIVEEPPEHLVFIFATTENEAVPATILSRCQAFQFRRVPFGEMVEYLTKVSEAEGLEASDHALRLIARASEGSVRDGIALLDQLATYGGGRVDDEEVKRILGAVDFAQFQRLLVAITGGDRDGVSQVVRHIEEQGWDPRHVYGEFLSYCRDALHLAIDRQARVELPADEASSLARDAEQVGYENLLRLLKLLLESEMSVRRSESAALALEIALLRAAELPKLTAIEDILSGSAPAAQGNLPAEGSGERTPSGGVEARAAKPAVSAAPRAGHEAPEPPPSEPPPTVALEEPPDLDTPPPPDEPAEEAAIRRAHIGEGAELVTSLLERISCVKQPLAVHLSGAVELSMSDDVFLIKTAPKDDFLERTLRRDTNREILDKTLAEMAGQQAKWRIRQATEEEASAADAQPADETSEPVEDDPTVQTVLEIFGGQIETIEERSEPA